MKTQLDTKQQKEVARLQIKHELENKLVELTGSKPSIISPDRDPFAVFNPKSKEEYLTILNELQPTNENAKVTFSGKDAINTSSPYLIDFGGLHSSPNYMEAKIRFNHAICPIWVKIGGELLEGKFSTATKRGDHRGFGNYETKYTLHADRKTTIQTYYGDNKTMYAANEAEAEELKNIIFS